MATDVDRRPRRTRVAREYFEALGRGERDAQQRYYAADAAGDVHGVVGPRRPRRRGAFFAELFDAFPDWRFDGPRDAWPRATARRCAGAPARRSPGRAASRASSPTARASTSRASTSARARRAHRGNDAYMNGAELARQLGALPPAGLRGRGADGQGVQPDHARQAAHRHRPRARRRRRLGRARRLPEQDDERLPRARRRRRDALRRRHQGDDRAPSRPPARRWAASRACVLGHGHPDHRGVAPELGVAGLCHPDDREDAEGDGGMHYFDFSKLKPYARPVFPYLLRMWDGGPVTIAGTVAEGDEIAGFEVVHLPGHAPGPDRPVARGRPPRAGQRLLLHARPADRAPRPPARPARGVQPRHRAGARVDPQARGDGAGGRVGRATPTR